MFIEVCTSNIATRGYAVGYCWPTSENSRTYVNTLHDDGAQYRWSGWKQIATGGGGTLTSESKSVGWTNVVGNDTRTGDLLFSGPIHTVTNIQNQTTGYSGMGLESYTIQANTIRIVAKGSRADRGDNGATFTFTCQVEV